MSKSLKGSWTRAKVNHPRKLIIGGGASANAGAAILIPFDGGITFACVAILSAVGGGMGAMADHIENDFGKAHRRPGTVSCDGKNYLGTEAQENAYRRLARKIEGYKTRFDIAKTKSEKKRFLRKAQACVRKQEYILEDMTEEGKPRPHEDMEFTLKRRSVKGKTPGVGAN